jgi:hypothetical protein
MFSHQQGRREDGYSLMLTQTQKRNEGIIYRSDTLQSMLKGDKNTKKVSLICINNVLIDWIEWCIRLSKEVNVHAEVW